MWDVERARAAMQDELHKIAEFSLSGLSPETVLSLRSPEPMETEGVRRAREILDRAGWSKTANLSPVPTTDTPSRQDIEEEAAHDRKINQGRAMGRSVLTGAGVGRLLSEVSLKTTGNLSPLRRTVGTAVGAAAGMADHLAERRYQARREERQRQRQALQATQPVKLSSAIPRELQRLEEERSLKDLAERNPLVDSEKLRSKMQAMRRGQAIGASLTPLALAALALHPSGREFLKSEWKSSPAKTLITYTPAVAGLTGLGAKGGAALAGKLHDLRHGSAMKEKKSSADPKRRLEKSRRAFTAHNPLTVVRNETVIPRKP